MKRPLFRFIPFAMLVMASALLQAQDSLKTLSLDDVKQWRRHTISLSDDGQWYTVLYTLIEKADALPDSVDSDSVDASRYGDKVRSNVLYICDSVQGVKYQIKNGKDARFSSDSRWIAYAVKPDKDEKKGGKGDDAENLIELKNLYTGFTRQFKSDADFRFAEDAPYFVSSDKQGLLIFDLDRQQEHFIGQMGEYVIEKGTPYIVYTIATEDQRGNGIYRFHPPSMTTQALVTGNHIYSNLSWNKARTALAAIRYDRKEDEVVKESLNLIVVGNAASGHPSVREYADSTMQGMPEHMGLAVKTGRYENKIVWIGNSERLLVQLKKYETPAKDKKAGKKKEDDEATVDVWHWKDKKLLSERMIDEKNNQNEVWDALFVPQTMKMVQISSPGMKRLVMAPGAEKWALGLSDTAYISDWDISRYDLYKIDLETGDRALIEEAYAGTPEVSPSGQRMVLWKDGHYWSYDFESGKEINLTQGLPCSFVDEEYDHWGYEPAYGFAGWFKGEKSILVNHKLDLWRLPVTGRGRAANLTQSVTQHDSIQFRIEDRSFQWEDETEKRYVDSAGPIILSAFDRKTKAGGFYSLDGKKLSQLIFKPASYGQSRWRSSLIKAKKSDALIYEEGDYQRFPEAYLSDINFRNARKITETNAQQSEYAWGHRILIHYQNDDGVPLDGVLSIPDSYKEGQKLPMVVYSYEKLSQGLFQHETPRVGGASICEMMYVSDGYLVLRPDIYFNVGTPHSDMHECIDAAIRRVIELGYVDEKRIGYEGFSFGGHCGMYMSTQPNRFAAIAAGAGVSNLVQGFNIDIVRDGSNEQDYYMLGQGRLGTDPTSNTDMFISESAVFNARGMDTPLLLFHGTEDNVVQWEHSFGFYSILRYLKKPVVFLSYKGEGHGLRKQANREDIQIRLKAYFDHYLKGKAAEKWMTEELPFESPEEKSGKKDKRPEMPLWK